MRLLKQSKVASKRPKYGVERNSNRSFVGLGFRQCFGQSTRRMTLTSCLWALCLVVAEAFGRRRAFTLFLAQRFFENWTKAQNKGSVNEIKQILQSFRAIKYFVLFYAFDRIIAIKSCNLEGVYLGRRVPTIPATGGFSITRLTASQLAQPQTQDDHHHFQLRSPLFTATSTA